MRRFCALLCLSAIGVADDNRSLPDRTRQYLVDLIKIDSSNPPGNETAVAQYLKQVADSHAISCDLMGNDDKRKNFVARLKGSGRGRRNKVIAPYVCGGALVVSIGSVDLSDAQRMDASAPRE